MQNRRGQSRRIALCGMFAALSLVCMMMGSILPFSTFLAPAISGLLILPIVLEYGSGAGLLLYFATALLSFFMAPDKEMSLIFIFLLGWYPIVKRKLDRLRSKAAQWGIKLIVFNACVFAMYAMILFLFPLPSVTAELEHLGIWLVAGLLVAGNVTFVIYDFALSRSLALYLNVWRPKLMRMH